MSDEKDVTVEFCLGKESQVLIEYDNPDYEE